MKTVDELTDLFRTRNLKVTPQRQCVFRVLHHLEGTHPSADAIHSAVLTELPTVSLKTVYQTLNDLVSMGELRHVELGSGPARFDINLDNHQHLSCERCGRIRDVSTPLDHLDLTEVTEFVVASVDVVFRGVCTSCIGVDTPPPFAPPFASNPAP
jgi:Fur family transcriptional regulator, stress-responsive regulator